MGQRKSKCSSCSLDGQMMVKSLLRQLIWLEMWWQRLWSRSTQLWETSALFLEWTLAGSAEEKSSRDQTICCFKTLRSVNQERCTQMKVTPEMLQKLSASHIKRQVVAVRVTLLK